MVARSRIEVRADPPLLAAFQRACRRGRVEPDAVLQDAMRRALSEVAALEPWITRTKGGVWSVAEGAVGYRGEFGTLGDLVEALTDLFGGDALVSVILEDERLAGDEDDDGARVHLDETLRVRDLAAEIRKHVQGAI